VSIDIMTRYTLLFVVDRTLYFLDDKNKKASKY